MAVAIGAFLCFVKIGERRKYAYNMSYIVDKCLMRCYNYINSKECEELLCIARIAANSSTIIRLFA